MIMMPQMQEGLEKGGKYDKPEPRRWWQRFTRKSAATYTIENPECENDVEPEHCANVEFGIWSRSRDGTFESRCGICMVCGFNEVDFRNTQIAFNTKP